jgi:hypothetical protein
VGLHDVGAIVIHLGNPKWERRLVNVSKHFFEERFVDIEAGAIARLCNCVPEWLWCWEFVFLTSEDLLDLVIHHFGCVVISDEMVYQLV